MKRILLFFALILLGITALHAQTIVLGNRVPELKVTTWMQESQPAATPLTYIEFYHSTNKACLASLEHLRQIAGQFDAQLRILVITQEQSPTIQAALKPFLSPQMGVGFDPTGKNYLSFGVSYIPFGVLVDAKNRALWMGNSLLLTPEKIRKITK